MRKGVRTPSATPRRVPVRRVGKKPFDIDDMMRRLREAVRGYPKAVLFELADRGYGSPFQILVACVITIRTLEEVSLPTAVRLFETNCRPSAQ